MREISSGRPQRPLLPDSTETEYVYSSTATAEVHLRDYFKVLVKRRRLLIGVLLAVVAIGAYFSFTATPLYKATSIIKIEPQNPSVTGIGEMLRLSEGGGPYDYHQTQFQLLNSRTLAAKVIADLRLDADKSFTGASITSSNPISRVQSWFFGNLQFVVSLIKPLQKEEPKNTQVESVAAAASQKPLVAPGLIGLYSSFLEVKPVKSTRLVEISFATPDAGLSQQLAEAHARGFIRMSLENRFELTQEAREFLDTKNTELREKLAKSEAALNRFRQTHGVVSMEKGENIVVDRLVTLNQQLTAARAQRIEAESLYKVVENKSTQYLSQVMSQGMVPTLRSNLLGLEAEKVRVSTVFKPDHPRMMELNQQINETRRALNTEINNVVRGIHENYVAALTKEQALQAEAQKQQQMALNLKEVGVEFAVLDEEVKVNRAIYENVLRRLSETTVSNDLAVSNMQISQHAEKSSRPFSPDIPFALVQSAFLGLFLGVGLVFFFEYLDSRLNTPQHVWHAVALNTFGVVPDLNSFNRRLLGWNPSERPLLKGLTRLRLQAPNSSPGELISTHHPFSIITESYRTIRTALLFSQAEKPPQIVLLTSPSPGEGKTVTTLNLAIALAQDSHRVLVIDADLRKGSCHTRLGMKNHKGLSNVLTGNLTLEEGIQATSVSGLSFLSRGICPPNPTDLLGSHKMREILNNLRESFNFILIDSPPAIAVSDAAVLSIVCDGVILVFHGQKTTTASARQLVERLDAIRAPILGVVLNGIDLADPNYAYYHHYYGSNYDGSTAHEVKNGGETTTEIATYADLTETEIWARVLGPGTVPREFFQHMVSNLSEAVGPMAPLILRDHIELLGESFDNFPKRRLNELFEKLYEEIPDEGLRKGFQNTMWEKIRSFATFHST